MQPLSISSSALRPPNSAALFRSLGGKKRTDRAPEGDGGHPRRRNKVEYLERSGPAGLA